MNRMPNRFCHVKDIDLHKRPSKVLASGGTAIVSVSDSVLRLALSKAIATTSLGRLSVNSITT